MFDLLGEGIVSEIYSGQFCVVGQRIDDQLKARTGLSSQWHIGGHNDNGLFRSEGMD